MISRMNSCTVCTDDNFHLYYGKRLVFIFFLIFHLTSVFGITLYMKDIVPADEPVTLGALLSIKGAPLSLQNRIQEYKLTLPADRVHLVPSRYIREIISTFTDQSVIITGKRTILLPVSYLKNWSGEFVHKFTGFLDSELCKGNNRVEVELPFFPAIEDEGAEYLFDIQGKREFMGFPVGEMELTVMDKACDESEKLVVFLNIHQYIPMVKAAETLEQDEVLSWEKLVIIEEELNPFKGEVLKEEERAGEYQTVRRIARGDIIYKSSVKRILHVRAGESVTIVIKKGTILLSMTGKAADSGAVGETVKVKPSQSTEWIIGKVTGRREVLIEM